MTTNYKRVFAHQCNAHRKILDPLVTKLKKEYLGGGLKPRPSAAQVSHLQGAIRWLLSALWVAHGVRLDRVVLPLGKRSFSGRPYGEKVTRRALNILAGSELVSLIKAPKGLNIAHASEVVATKILRQHFDEIGFVWTQQEPERREVIFLRFKDEFFDWVERLPIPDTPETEQMRQEIHRINRATDRHVIFPHLPDGNLVQLMNRSDKKHCNFRKTHYRRIFVEGRFDRCGRFFGPWWQSIKKENRPHIRIDGEPTIELDYKSTFFSLAYARLGQRLTRDAYDVGIGPAGDEWTRDKIKEFANAILNDRNDRYTLGREVFKQLGVTRKGLLRRLEERHPLIAHLFGSGVGLELMWQESEIARLVLLEMCRRGLPVLCLHDGFRVKEKDRDVLEKVMIKAFFKVAGVMPGIGEKPTAPKALDGQYLIYDKFMSTFKVRDDLEKIRARLRVA